MYLIEFDNYLKNKHQAKWGDTHIRSFNGFITPSYSAFEMLKTHLQNASSHYISFLEFACPYLFHPDVFTAVQGGLIKLQKGSCCFSDSRELFDYILLQSNAIGYEINFEDAYFQKLYDLYYSYLKTYSRIPSPYNRYISNVYKSFYTIPPLYDSFIRPFAYFRIINKELFYSDPIYEDTGFNVISMLLRHCNSPKKITPILKMLPRIMDDSNIVTSIPCCNSNYSFNFTANKKLYYAYFSSENIKCEPNVNPHTNLMISIDLDSFQEFSLQNSDIDFLYTITGGIKKNIDNLSVLCAIIMTNYYKNIRYTLPSKNCSPLSLFIVYAPGECLECIHYYLEMLVLSKSLKINYQLKDIIRTKNIFDLIVQNYCNPTYIPVMPSKSKELENQIAKIKKLIQRKEIKIKDKYGLSHSLINHLPVICFVDNPKQLSLLQANYKTKTFNFSFFQYLDRRYDINVKLLSGLLSIHGLKLLYDSNFGYGKNQNQNTDVENITEAFIRDCLKPEEGHACYTDYLYKVYTNYYHLFYAGEPLTKICFTKEMRKLLPNCQYKKPRHSRSDSRYAFIGINIDIEKAESISLHADKTQEGTAQSFKSYLNSIKDNANEILLTLFDSVRPKQLRTDSYQAEYKKRIREVRNRLYGNNKYSK